MEYVLEERSSPSLIEIFLYQLHKMGGNTVFLKVSLSIVPTLLRHYLRTVPLFIARALYRYVLEYLTYRLKKPESKFSKAINFRMRW